METSDVVGIIFCFLSIFGLFSVFNEKGYAGYVYYSSSLVGRLFIIAFIYGLPVIAFIGAVMDGFRFRKWFWDQASEEWL